ncbi:Dysferlin [Ancistrocladus abbreviatus]
MFARTAVSSISFSPNAEGLCNIKKNYPFIASPTAGLSISRLSSSSLYSSSSSLSLKLFALRKRGNGAVMAALDHPANITPLTGIVFQPFEEMKNEAFVVPVAPRVSLARQKYVEECEAAVNEQINVEYNASYAYHSLFAYFDRDNIALRGFAKFFKKSSEEEREHAEKLMKFQNIRGGKVKLYSVVMPLSEFEHDEKGDALYAMELALSLEKLVNEKLLQLHSVAEQNNDPQMQAFIETEFLTEQVEAIKKISEYVTQLRMVGKGHGVWHFDQVLLHEGAEVF